MPESSRFRHVWPLVGRNNAPGKGLSRETEKSLRLIFRTLQDANFYILEWVGKLGFTPTDEQSDDLRTLEIMNHLNSKGDLPELIESFQECYMSGIPKIWRRTFHSALSKQGKDSFAAQWRFLKSLAFDLLEKRGVAARIFILIETDLRADGLDDVCEDIVALIMQLERFAQIYDHQFGDISKTPYPFYPSPIRHRAAIQLPAKSFSSLTPQNPYTPHLVAIVSITTLVSIIPMGLAWKASTIEFEYGTSSDSDFYIQIQSSIRTILGICIGLYPTFGRPASAVKYWAQALAALGVICALAAVVAYLRLPVIWSAVAAFASNAIQVYMALQLVFVPEPGGLPVKQD
jgi:hypothetical protein